MSRWFQRIGMRAVALSFAAMLVNCDGGGGGGGGDGTIRLFFAINGDGTCSNVVVNVDLADAEAILARNNGDIDCALDVALASRGCNVTFTELNNGDDLRVTINGCTIPETTNLFSCGFTDVDISDLNSESSAQCTCAVPGCDQSPPLCIDEDLDPRSCEDCDNNIDDDANGQIDCDDPNCEHEPPCTDPVPSTTVTTTSTSSSVTIPAEPISINFRLTSSSEPLGALQFTVNYTSAPGRFEGSGDAVECFSHVAGAVFAANNNTQTRKLTLGLISLSGFDAPTDLVSCSFLPRPPVPVPANFTVVINDVSATDGDPATAAVGVTVTQ